METGATPVRARRRETQSKPLFSPEAAFGEDTIGEIREGEQRCVESKYLVGKSPSNIRRERRQGWGRKQKNMKEFYRL